MKAWWQHHHSETPHFETDADKRRVEDLTGCIPLLGHFSNGAAEISTQLRTRFGMNATFSTSGRISNLSPIT
jgi:hypothetical protein